LDAALRRAPLCQRDDARLIDLAFISDAFQKLLAGLPLTLQLALLSTALGALLALALAAMRVSGIAILDATARLYVFALRGTPLLVQIFLIYYGLGQFRAIRMSVLWPFLREPYWCAILALTLNTAAYASEIVRGGLVSVPRGEIEAARACGMSRLLVFRRIVLPLALRQALPAYGNELIIMIKATSLASIITLMEITGIAAKLVSETYRVIEVFVVAGTLYLAINFVLTRIVMAFEYRLTPHLRPAPAGLALHEGDAG
jgi:octopine/nopaline transport system permease protein